MTMLTPIEALYRHAETHPDRAAFTAGRDSWSYAQLAAAVERLARALASRGVAKGDRVVLHMANLPEFAMAYYACFRIGAIAAPMNIRFKSAELAPLLRRLRPALYIGQPDLYPCIAATDPTILAADRRFIVGGTVADSRAQPWSRLLADGIGEGHLPATDADAPALLLGTSGTTGQSKFVAHTQKTLTAGMACFEQIGLDRGQTTIECLPMVHASGFFTFFASMLFGARVVLLERFDPDAVLDAVAQQRGSWLAGLPFMFAALLERQRARAREIGALRTCLTGGDVCPAWLQAEFPGVFGIPLRSFWASTEGIGSLIHGLKPGPLSRIARGAEVRVIDDHGVPVPRGKVGELALRGPNVTIGYWAGPGQIQDACEDGWFRTGDLMRHGEGDDIWFVSRKKDLIIRGGSNIAPSEVEGVLIDHPAVGDAAVVGVSDAVLGQRVAGFVQLVDGASTAVLDDIVDDVRARLADYKVPETLQIVREIPRNALGKIDRKRLAEMVLPREADDAVASAR